MKNASNSLQNSASHTTKAWGWQQEIVNNEEYCGKLLHVIPGFRCSTHFHRLKLETFLIKSGEMLLSSFEPGDIFMQELASSKDVTEFQDRFNILNMPTRILKEGDTFTINRLCPHWFTSNTDQPCEFYEFSTHHEDSDSYRIVQGGKLV